MAPLLYGRVNMKNDLNEEESNKVALAAGTFRDRLAATNEPIYAVVEELPITNGHHARIAIYLRQNSFIEGIAFVKPDFRNYVEVFFNSYGLIASLNNSGTIINIWVPKDFERFI